MTEWATDSYNLCWAFWFKYAKIYFMILEILWQDGIHHIQDGIAINKCFKFSFMCEY